MSPGPDAQDLFRRIRSWNLSSWRRADRIGITRAALSALAEMASSHDGVQRPEVPDAGIHALADQLEVLTADAIEAGGPTDDVDAVLSGLARDLGLAKA